VAPVVKITNGMVATAVATIKSGSITKVELIDGGSGYTSVPLVKFSGTSGSGANYTATVSGEK
jgi:hypothetical protein